MVRESLSDTPERDFTKWDIIGRAINERKFTKDTCLAFELVYHFVGNRAVALGM
jgi:hypothetical protein